MLHGARSTLGKTISSGSTASVGGCSTRAGWAASGGEAAATGAITTCCGDAGAYIRPNPAA